MLNDLKLLLGITDTSQDTRLNWLLHSVSNRLCILINEESVPESLEDVVVEVAVIRFNKIGSEGLASHSVEGESMNFSSDDFAGHMNVIQAWINAQESKKTGKVKFI